jgi:hypothetical protein
VEENIALVGKMKRDKLGSDDEPCVVEQVFAQISSNQKCLHER